MDLSSWRFDVASAIMTAVVMPIALYLLGIFLRFSKRWLGYLAEGVLSSVAGFLGPTLARSLTLKKYCRLSLEMPTKFLYVPSRQDFRLSVDAMLVPLSLSRGDDGIAIPQADLLSAGSRLLLIGDPGSGKSSLSKWIFRQACRAAIKHPRTARLPVLFELKSLREEMTSATLLRRLRETVGDVRAYRTADCFDTLATSSGLLLILDGLDEVSASIYPSVEGALNGLGVALAGLSERNVLVVTMRRQFYLQVRDAYRSGFDATLSLQPFAESDIYEFLSRWPFPASREVEVNRIFGELSERPSLKEMCRNPLVLAMYVAEDQSGGNIVPPDSRTVFYAKVCDELLLRRRLSQLKERPLAPAKLKEQRERILGRIAYEHILDVGQPANLITWNSALTITAEVTGRPESAADSLRELCKETGILSEERHEQTLRFIHLTFCEYFAALYAVMMLEGGWVSLIQTHAVLQKSYEVHARTRLRECIPFAAGLVTARMRSAAIADVDALGDDDLLLMTFLETKAYELTQWGRVLERRSEFFANTKEGEWTEPWLRSLQLFSVAVRDAKSCSSHYPNLASHFETREIIEALLARNPGAFERLLSAYATQDAAAAFRLAESYGRDVLTDFPEMVLRFCSERPFFELVRERALHPGSLRGLTILAEAGLRHRTTARWLNRIKPSPTLEDRIRQLPRRRRWTQIRNGLFQQCLSLARSREVAEARLVEVMEAVPVPYLNRLLPLVGLLFCVGVFSVWAWLLLARGGGPDTNRLVGSRDVLQFIPGAIAGYGVLYLCLVRWTRSFYALQIIFSGRVPDLSNSISKLAPSLISFRAAGQRRDPMPVWRLFPQWLYAQRLEYLVFVVERVRTAGGRSDGKLGSR